MKREANFQVTFNQYVRTKKLEGYFELKQTRTEMLPFVSVEDHQIEGLRAAQNNGFVYKLSDADQRIKPFDSFSTPPLTSYIVIKYPKIFVLIKLNDFVKEKETSTKKSLSKQRALDIATFACID